MDWAASSRKQDLGIISDHSTTSGGDPPKRLLTQWDFRIYTTLWLIFITQSSTFWMGVVLSVIFPISTRTEMDKRDRLLVFLVHEVSRPRDKHIWTWWRDTELPMLGYGWIGQFGLLPLGRAESFCFQQGERAAYLVTTESWGLFTGSLLWRHIKTVTVYPPWGRCGHVACLVHCVTCH